MSEAKKLNYNTRRNSKLIKKDKDNSNFDDNCNDNGNDTKSLFNEIF